MSHPMLFIFFPELISSLSNYSSGVPDLSIAVHTRQDTRAPSTILAEHDHVCLPKPTLCVCVDRLITGVASWSNLLLRSGMCRSRTRWGILERTLLRPKDVVTPTGGGGFPAPVDEFTDELALIGYLKVQVIENLDLASRWSL